MNYKINEVMDAYANIIGNMGESQQPEQLWHSTVDFGEDLKSIEVEQVSLQTNAFTSFAADRAEQNDIKEKLTPTEIEDMIEKAHPESVYIADAMGDGGLVENQNELHDKLVRMINKYPSGSTGHKYASLVEDLVAIANDLDANGNAKAAMQVDAFIQQTLKKKSSGLKVAWIPIAVGIGTALLGGGGSLYSMINGMQENLAKDAQDLADNIAGWVNDREYQAVRPAANQALSDCRTIVNLGRELMNSIAMMQKNGSPQLAQHIDKLSGRVGELVSDIDANVNRAASVAGSGKTGLDFRITLSKLNDLKTSFSQLQNAASSNPSAADPFDSPEMEGATRQVHTDGGHDDSVSEPVAPARQPLDKDATLQAQLFINRAYKPVAAATGIIDERWYAGIKEMVDSLRGRLQAAASVQDPEAAAETGINMNITKFVQLDDDGGYSLLVSAVDINKLLNLVEMAEEQAKTIQKSRVMAPHESLVD
jgi:hypothetical protein